MSKGLSGLVVSEEANPQKSVALEASILRTRSKAKPPAKPEARPLSLRAPMSSALAPPHSEKRHPLEHTLPSKRNVGNKELKQSSPAGPDNRKVISLRNTLRVHETELPVKLREWRHG